MISADGQKADRLIAERWGIVLTSYDTAVQQVHSYIAVGQYDQAASYAEIEAAQTLTSIMSGDATLVSCRSELNSLQQDLGNAIRTIYIGLDMPRLGQEQNAATCESLIDQYAGLCRNYLLGAKTNLLSQLQSLHDQVQALMLNTVLYQESIFHEDWESYAAGTNITATPSPAWEGYGDWWDGSAYRTLSPVRLDIVADAHPGWGQGLSGYSAGGYYSGYKVLNTRTWWKKTFGVLSAGVITATMNICPSGYLRMSPSYPAGTPSWIGLVNQYTQVATWQLVDPAAQPSDTATMKLVYAGGESPQFVIDATNSETILTVTVDLNNMKVSGSITQGDNVWNTLIYNLTPGTTLDSIAFHQYKRSRYEFDVNDIMVNRTGAPGIAAGDITLTDYIGDAMLAPIKIELIQGGSVVRTEWVSTTSNPQPYAVTGITPGTYDIAFSACKWLKKVFNGVEIVGATTTPLNAPVQ